VKVQMVMEEYFDHVSQLCSVVYHAFSKKKAGKYMI